MTPGGYRNPVPTVDLIIEIAGRGVVLIRRKNPPWGWALPGGFVDYGESLEQAAVREAREETSLEVSLAGQFHTYSAPDRDPRQHTVTTVFLARARGLPRAADDAAEVGLFKASNLPSPLAFDHAQILKDYFMKKNSPAEWPSEPDEEERRIQAVADLLRERLPAPPAAALILGTGLSGVADHIEGQGSLAYEELPWFPSSTVASHAGKLIWGKLAGKTILALQGRFHLYEGYSPRQLGFPVRILAAMGIRILILTNAAGGLDPAFQPGEIMLISDHLNMTGENPLIGPHRDSWGPRFPDMSRVYDPDLQALARETAREARMPLRQGVYAAVKGPSLEPPAETRLLMTLGAQAVGMSTVMEAIVAVQAQMRLLGFSVITNVNRLAEMEPIALDSVIETAEKAEPKLLALIRGILAKIS
jgi:purine-nucleoside phosphorylase